MPLRITLKPYERVVINGATIRNGERPTDFLFETQCKFLRESEIIRDSEADTLCKRLCVTLQVVYLSDDPAESTNLFVQQANEVMKLVPEAGPFILQINDFINEKQYHKAIKVARKLVEHEHKQLTVH